MSERNERLRIRLADGTPVVDASVHVDGSEGPVLVDPGECDDVGELRCFHPGGVYRLLARPKGALEVRIDGPAGLDRLRL